jgi:hypothetical protein
VWFLVGGVLGPEKVYLMFTFILLVPACGALTVIPVKEMTEANGAKAGPGQAAKRPQGDRDE